MRGDERWFFTSVFKETAGHFGGNTQWFTGDVVKDKNRDTHTGPFQDDNNGNERKSEISESRN